MAPRPKGRGAFLCPLFRVACKNRIFAFWQSFCHVKMERRGPLELMAPAGDGESLQAALDAGADSVYFGVGQFNMRARATVNFTAEDLGEVVRRCRERGVRSYLAVNTIVYDHDLEAIEDLLDKALQAGVSAVIASDISVILATRARGLEVHISTQQNISNIRAVEFFSAYADTMVLARELSLTQVKEICRQIDQRGIKGPSGRKVEVEIFGHGALCMAISGKCYLSLHAHNSSANRGACRQDCRRAYVVRDKETGYELEVGDPYIMSPKDLCTIGLLDRIVDAGARILKIEGRGRSPEYVQTVVSVYREAIDACARGEYSAEKVPGWEERLREVYNRGFWEGYYLGRRMGQWSGYPGSHATRRKVYVGRGLHYYPKPGVGEILVEAAELHRGDELLITGPTTGVKTFALGDFMVDDRPATRAGKGDHVTLPLDFKLRTADKVYKVEATEYADGGKPEGKP